jgi:hypothetical protein
VAGLAFLSNLKLEKVVKPDVPDVSVLIGRHQEFDEQRAKISVVIFGLAHLIGVPSLLTNDGELTLTASQVAVGLVRLKEMSGHWCALGLWRNLMPRLHAQYTGLI